MFIYIRVVTGNKIIEVQNFNKYPEPTCFQYNELYNCTNQVRPRCTRK